MESIGSCTFLISSSLRPETHEDGKVKGGLPSPLKEKEKTGKC